MAQAKTTNARGTQRGSLEIDVTVRHVGRIKRATGASRMALARAAGGRPGESVAVTCATCPASGTVYWPLRRNGLPGRWVAFTHLEIDHILPESRGGSSLPANLRLLCRRCNRTKGAKQEP